MGGLALGGFLYLVGDTASDYLTFSSVRAAALQLAEQDAELKQLVGQPYTTGMWYNSTLGFSHRDKVAHCTFQLQGSQRVTDIAVKAGRQHGPKSNVLYNIIGPGTWRLISCQAMVPSEGGLVQPRSLLPEHREEREQLQQQKQKLAVSEWGCCKWLVVGIGWCLFFWSGQPTTAESSNREPPLKKGLQKEGCNPTGICLRRRRYSAATTWF